MSLYPETTGAVSVSPKREYKEEEEREYDEEQDEQEEQEEEEPEESDDEEQEEEEEKEEEEEEEESEDEEEEEIDDESDDEEEEEEEDEEEEEEEEEESEDEEEEEEEEEAQEKEQPTSKAKEISVRFAVFMYWLLVFHLASSTIVTGITGLIVNSAKCFGGIIGLAAFVLPAAYAISPERVCNFKFRSLAPTIADGLYKLDYFVKRLVRAIGDKLSDKLKLKQV